mgnify:CR=1 FL=1
MKMKKNTDLPSKNCLCCGMACPFNALSAHPAIGRLGSESLPLILFMARGLRSR